MRQVIYLYQNGVLPMVYPNQHLQAGFVAQRMMSEKPKSKAKFVKVTLPIGLQEQPEPQTRNTADITVEYKSFKITIPANIDIGTLENILKVVLQADV